MRSSNSSDFAMDDDDDDDSDRSSEATQFRIVIRERNRHNNDDVEKDISTVNVSELPTSMEFEAHSRIFQSETLGSGLTEVAIKYEMREDELEHSKNQLQGSHQEALAVGIAQAAQTLTGNNKIKLLGIPSSSSEQSPPISSHPINSQEETLSIEKTTVNIREKPQKITSDHKTVTTSQTVKTSIDGYNWKKYCQAPVKSPQGLRSYYKCTYNECRAKKIESCDQYNSVAKIYYIGQHEHDPPEKVFSKKGNNSSQERTSNQCKSSGSVSNGPILVEEIYAPPLKQSPPISSHPINSQEETLSLEQTPVNIREENQKITSDHKTVTTSQTVKTPIDGYNWRKYSQKPVKSPQGFRSYFKCAYNECRAKKIEYCDQYNSVAQIYYKGQHEHDPPEKVFSKNGKNSSQEQTSRQCKSSGSVSNGPMLVEEIDAPPPKRRLVKKSSSASPGSVLKRPKKPKFVIHAASDIGISADGYRWRKYGQKMVNGNPNPWNYYKCCSDGCPVRKHIEMAVDGSSEVILTYKGVHDHDMPVRAKAQGPPTLLLNDNSSPSKNNNSQSKKVKPFLKIV